MKAKGRSERMMVKGWVTIIPGVPTVAREAHPLASSFGHLGIREPGQQYRDGENMKIMTTTTMMRMMLITIMRTTVLAGGRMASMV